MKVCPKCGNRVYGNYKLCRACRVKEPKLYKQPMREMKVVKCVKCGDYFNTSQSSVGRKKEVCKSCQRPTGSEFYIQKIKELKGGR